MEARISPRNPRRGWSSTGYDLHGPGLGCPTIRTPDQSIIFLQNGGPWLAPYPRKELTDDVAFAFASERSRFPGNTNTRWKAEVEGILALAEHASRRVEKPAQATSWGRLQRLLLRSRRVSVGSGLGQ